ncbi:hypothetical protein [Rhodospirillum rubrum]|uniref:hypothetical protein n=1 Tax=Rhodospirillum rubrum TaxID=1085 RepID=UPI0028AFF010|nr:hypothetical protein [Rhodospirillum rubrum]
MDVESKNESFSKKIFLIKKKDIPKEKVYLKYLMSFFTMLVAIMTAILTLFEFADRISDKCHNYEWCKNNIYPFFNEISKKGEDSIETIEIVEDTQKENSINECDLLAGADHDKDRPKGYPFVPIKKIKWKESIKFCESAFFNEKKPRFAFLAGRSYHAASQYEKALDWYIIGARKGYAAAQDNLGYILAGHATKYYFCPDQAEYWLENAKKNGDPDAEGHLLFLHKAFSNSRWATTDPLICGKYSQ